MMQLSIFSPRKSLQQQQQQHIFDVFYCFLSRITVEDETSADFTYL